MLASVMPGHEKAMIPRITPTSPRNTSDHQFFASASSIELLLLSGYAACPRFAAGVWQKSSSVGHAGESACATNAGSAVCGAKVGQAFSLPNFCHKQLR